MEMEYIIGKRKAYLNVPIFDVPVFGGGTVNNLELFERGVVRDETKEKC